MASLFAQQIIEDLEKDIAKNSRRGGAAWVAAVQKHPRVPVDTGRLRRGIQLVSSTTRSPVKIRIASTARSPQRQFDYPAHINTFGKHFMWWEAVTGDDTVEAAVNTLLDGV